MPKLARVMLALFMASVAGHAADAAATRYVASTGSDGNNCTLGAPCRTLQRGVNRTPDGGELIVLDSGDFGGFTTVNKSLTISAKGATPTLVGAARITIDNASAVVTLRGLHLNGGGIEIAAATSVHIERCTIERASTGGISGSDTELFVTDSIVRDNGQGLFVVNVRLTVDNARFERNGLSGAVVRDGDSTITRSVFSGHGENGVLQFGGRMNVTRTTAANNRDGYVVDSNGRMTLESSVARGNSMHGLLVTNGRARVSRSVFTDNDVGIRVLAAGTAATARTCKVRAR